MSDPPTAPDPWGSGTVTARTTCLLEANAGPMTLDGTNTWVLLEPGSDLAVVVDPGELDDPHLQAVAAAVDGMGARVGLVLLTHGHRDHAQGAERFAQLTGAPVRGAGRGEPFTSGERLDTGGLAIEALLTPGHTSDSVSFLLRDDRALLTGDMVLGRGTTVVAWPDGELASYLSSLDTMSRRTDSGEVTTLLPWHGPVLTQAGAVLSSYREHRLERLEQVRAAVAAGVTDARAVVEAVYAAVPREVWPAAELSVRAQLAYLEREGQGSQAGRE